MNPDYEIYYIYDLDIVGSAIKLEDGDLSITINGNFVGVFDNFDKWNINGDYAIREIINNNNKYSNNQTLTVDVKENDYEDWYAEPEDYDYIDNT